MGDEAQGEPVQLYVYDLSGGMARAFSQMLLGRQIDAIYHTSVVVGGAETYYGGGINVAPAGNTPFGQPIQRLDLGRTQLPQEVREELLAELSERYTPAAYSLWANNCNNFSDEYAQLLCGTGVPPHITGLPQEVLATPFGQMLQPMLAGLERQLGSMRQQALVPAGAAAGAAALPAPAAAAVGDYAPALHAAELSIEGAVAAGMMQGAAEQRLHAAAAPQAPAAAAGAAALARAAAAAGAAPGPVQGAGDERRLATELAVEAEFNRLVASGEAAGDEARALALKAVAAAAHAGTDNPAQHRKEDQQAGE